MSCFLAKAIALFVELGRCGAAGRAVGVAEDEEFGFGADVGGDAVEVGEEIVLGGERELVDDCRRNSAVCVPAMG